MVAKFLEADLLGRKQNRKNRMGETGAFLKCKAKQRRAEEQEGGNWSLFKMQCKAEERRRAEPTKINHNERGLKRNENY
jgi:hypothetical protein